MIFSTNILMVDVSICINNSIANMRSLKHKKSSSQTTTAMEKE
jgi:hypothetical protein